MLELINVRFFVRCHDVSEDSFCDVDDIEVTIHQWESLDHTLGNIEYERFTVFENGCRQVCLTFDPLDTISSHELDTID